ncbi:MULTISPECIES: flavodoxin domain-containing protein [Desulfobacula]|uniref:Predicted flavodoxin/nitric oxide synthase n=2 Tax=Desulfobacula TaxID=28222 RepID=K0NJ48_DESTT|nr:MULTISPECIES: flavodoxin domain-containing protein [Desulfobacula]CCK79898.1 predicted flavodoxin/nitric oxide synthase [Desulfobacula toluolica Tol2]SDU19643.1 Flavodoxin domain-containing protein [Desulfobacula phenolica]
MGKVLIVYASRSDETKSIAELIAEGIRISGHEAELKRTSDIKSEDDLKGYDGYAFGSATYHGEMITSMKQILFVGERAELKDKPGGAFGAYGWSGEAPGRIFDTMDHIFGMKMVSGPLMLKASGVEGGIQAAQEYGKSIAKMI